MTSAKDICMPRIRQLCLLLKHQTDVRNTQHTQEFITLREARHVWTDQNFLTGKGRN